MSSRCHTPLRLPEAPWPRTRTLAAGALAAALTAGMFACAGDQDGPTGPSFAKGGTTPPLAVAPTATILRLAPLTTATLTAKATAGGTITAVTSDAGCATVAPASAVATKPMGSAVYVATFIVTPVGAGSCAITLTDSRTNQAQTQVIATAVRLRPATLAGGFDFTCGVATTGGAYCWGSNNYGTLGTRINVGTFNANPTPLAVSGNLSFASLAAGLFETCGLTGAGAAYCWGSGALGSTKRTGSKGPSTTPVAVEGGHQFLAITAGAGHVCGLTNAGAAYCWGGNFFGQVGTATGTGVNGGIPTPTAVSGGHTFVALSAGYDHTCGLTPLGAAWCWGDNTYLALGDPSIPGTTQINPTPVPVTGGLTFAELAAGGSATCGLTGAGDAYCWGNNASGQLGTPTGGQANATPQAVTGGLQFAEIRGGGNHACGRTGAGAAYCWGGNFYGQGGTTADINVPNSIHPTPTAVDGGLTFAALTGGSNHTCGLSSAGAASCWGLNVYGQLGNATNTGIETANPAPAAVGGGIAFALP